MYPSLFIEVTHTDRGTAAGSSAFPLSGVQFSWLLCACLYAHAHVLHQRGYHGLSGATDALAYGVM